jgi:Tfp pilus assembly protein PilN
MINLLPPERNLNMRIARNNTILRRYLELVLVSFVIIAAAVAGAYYFLYSQQQSVEKTVAINQAKVKELEPVQKQAEELSVTINTIAGLMSKNVKFSDMLTQIGGIMPEGSVLTGLQFSLENLSSPLVVSAQVGSEERAAVLRNNLASSPLFKDAKIVTITEIKSEDSAGDASATTPVAPQAESPYKYTTTINAYFKDGIGANKR